MHRIILSLSFIAGGITVAAGTKDIIIWVIILNLGKYMFCPNCGANVPGGVEVCPECGTEISVRRNDGGGRNEPFIVAEDEGEMLASAGPPISGDEENTQRSPIIEAEEDELPEEYDPTAEDGLQTEVMDGVPVTSAADVGGRNIQDDGSRTDRWWREPGGKGDGAVAVSSDDRNSGSEREPREPSHASSGDDPRFTVPSHGMTVTGASDGAEQKPRPSDSYPFTELPSRKRPLFAGLAVIILVVLGLAILVYGLPGGGSGDGGLPVPTPLPTPLLNDTPVPATETVPPWTPSENLVLSISAYGGGYKVEIDSGLRANEVAKIVLSVEDGGGLHIMEWAYPSRRESFFMAREAYNGTASASEHIIATATFNDGKKEVVFSADL